MYLNRTGIWYIDDYVIIGNLKLNFCGIGKRRFGSDWRKRIWLFDRLVWAVVGYGVKIWG